MAVISDRSVVVKRDVEPVLVQLYQRRHTPVLMVRSLTLRVTAHLPSNLPRWRLCDGVCCIVMYAYADLVVCRFWFCRHSKRSMGKTLQYFSRFVYFLVLNTWCMWVCCESFFFFFRSDFLVSFLSGFFVLFVFSLSNSERKLFLESCLCCSHNI